jgi:hypothetical protein
MEKTLDSGARLIITLSDFEVCDRLLIAVTKELEGVGINLGLKSGGLSDFLNMDIDKDAALNTLKNAIMRLAASTLIRPVLWECMGRVVYNGQKVTPKTFEGEKERGDWPIVAKEVLVANLLPFFPNLSSRLSTALKGAIESPR